MANSVMKYHYVWLIWSCAFLVPWIILYLLCNQQQRREMWWRSIFMAPFGLVWTAIYEHFTWKRSVSRSDGVLLT